MLRRILAAVSRPFWFLADAHSSKAVLRAALTVALIVSEFIAHLQGRSNPRYIIIVYHESGLARRP